MDDTICVNLSDLCLETLLRAIMDIRARLTSLVVRHLLPSPGTGFSYAGKAVLSILVIPPRRPRRREALDADFRKSDEFHAT
jgi:hypothetical protein